MENSTGMASAEAAIEKVLAAYETALNASDTSTVLSLFAPDGVFMAPNNASAVGATAIRQAYMGIFQAITFDTELTVQEIVQIAPDWAFVRTNSNGHVTISAINQRVPDANHELFVFQKDSNGIWKIARYSFATTLPLPH
ncbi:YybH family protein [Sphingomonas zeicaulis]|uniref:YybH family protein n=1 Tax=Sphingomonas zeicaulis TaxID=1632740 RepID=UPI003D197DC2